MTQLGHPSERFVILEDTYELQVTAKNCLHLHTTKTCNLLELTKTAMRLRPDRIIVGELRGPEAQALIKVWNTGHPGGITTIHANNAKSALRRLELLVEEAGAAAQPRLIAETINTIITIAKVGTTRHVTEIAHITGFSPKTNDYQLTYGE